MVTKISAAIASVCIFAILGACSHITLSAQPTNPPSPFHETGNPPSEFTLTPKVSTPTITSVASPTQDVGKNIMNRLPSGSYIIYQGINDLYAISPSSQSPITLVENIDSAVLSSNGKYLVYWSSQIPNSRTLIDISNGRSKVFTLNIECRFMTISPTGGFGACGGGDIYIFSLFNDGNLSQLTTWSESKPEDTWEFPVWSPDGNWLAYQNLGDISPSDKDGLYLTNLLCLSKIEKCREMTIGPLVNPRSLMNGPSSVSWSPDSKFLAIPSVDSIRILNMSTRKTTLLTKAYGGTSISWSPNGDWIAFTSFLDDNLYMISSHGGDVIPLNQYGDVVGWLVIP